MLVGKAVLVKTQIREGKGEFVPGLIEMPLVFVVEIDFIVAPGKREEEHQQYAQGRRL